MIRHDNPIYTLSEITNILIGTGGFTEEMISSINKIKGIESKETTALSILEAGCGTGKLGMFFAVAGMYYNGIDIDEEQLTYAKKLQEITQLILNRNIRATFEEGSVHKLSAKDSSFNFVFSEGVIEHWTGKKRQNVVNEMARVASDAVMIFVPWSGHPESRKISRECVHTFKGMGKREYPLSVNELRENLEDAGLKDIDVHPCNPDIPIARRMVFGCGYK